MRSGSLTSYFTFNSPPWVDLKLKLLSVLACGPTLLGPCGGGSAMDQCEDREEGAPPTKSSLCGEHDSQTKAQRSQMSS
ncbi:hypothetical protein NQZ68_028519, partial [Dissostichus eleginoides]